MARKQTTSPAADAEELDDASVESLLAEDSPQEPAPQAIAGGDDPTFSSPSLASLLRQKNIDLDDDVTDDDVLARFEELETAAEERDRLKQENEQYRAWLARQQHAPAPEPKQEAKEEAEKPKAPEAPEWNDTWEAYLERDDRGTIVIRKEYRGAVDPSLPEKYLKRKQWEQSRLQQLLSRADSLFDESALDTRLKDVEERAYKRAIEEFQKSQQQSTTQSYLAQYEKDNAAWLSADQQLRGLLSDRVAEFIERGFSAEQAVKYAQFDVEQQTGKAPWKKAPEEAPEPLTPAQRRVTLRAKSKTNGDARIPQNRLTKRDTMTQPVEAPASIRQIKNKYAAMFNESAE